MMLVLEVKTVYLLMNNRYEGLLAQDHVQNMVNLAEVQQNIFRLKAIYLEPVSNPNKGMKRGLLNYKSPGFGGAGY
jgi:hypothetical protein